MIRTETTFSDKTVIEQIVCVCWSGLILLAIGGCQSLGRSDNSAKLVADIPGTSASSKAELKPKDAAELCAATAKTLEQSGDPHGAIMMYERARVKDPRSMKQVCRRLAVLYDRVGEYKQALLEYEKALRLDPKDAEMLNNKGYCHYSHGQWDKATESFEQALAIEPDYDRARINLGMALGQQNRYEEALKAFERAVAEAEAHSNLAFVYMTQGKKAEAREHYQIARRLDPTLHLAAAAIHKIDVELIAENGDVKESNRGQVALASASTPNLDPTEAQKISTPNLTGEAELGSLRGPIAKTAYELDGLELGLSDEPR